MSRPSGFTLCLDGNPEDVARILGAVGAEFARVERDAWNAAEGEFGPRPPLRRLGSLRGRVELRYDLSDGFPEDATR